MKLGPVRVGSRSPEPPQCGVDGRIGRHSIANRGQGSKNYMRPRMPAGGLPTHYLPDELDQGFSRTDLEEDTLRRRRKLRNRVGEADSAAKLARPVRRAGNIGRREPLPG